MYNILNKITVLACAGDNSSKGYSDNDPSNNYNSDNSSSHSPGEKQEIAEALMDEIEENEVEKALDIEVGDTSDVGNWQEEIDILWEIIGNLF